MTEDRDVGHAMESAFTASQLIEMLQRGDPDARVFFVCDYGDHCHTEQALPVSELTDVDSGDLAPSAYSRSRVKLVEDDPDDEPREKADELFPVVILR